MIYINLMIYNYIL